LAPSLQFFVKSGPAREGGMGNHSSQESYTEVTLYN